MKRGTPDHHKTRDLAESLGVPRYSAVGILEAMWHATADEARAGDIGKMSNKRIAECCFWDGDPDVLVAALVRARWLDTCARSRLVVHDWPEHCDNFVHKSLARAHLRFADGTVPKLAGLNPYEKAEAEKAFAATNGRQRRPTAANGRRRLPHDRTALPCPALPCLALPEEGAAPEPAAERELFDQFWQTYPRRTGKGQALRAWGSAVKIADPKVIVSAAREFASSPKVLTSERRFVKHPATWLNARGWEDDRAEWSATSNGHATIGRPIPAPTTDAERSAAVDRLRTHPEFRMRCVASWRARLRHDGKTAEADRPDESYLSDVGFIDSAARVLRGSTKP